MSKMVTMVSQIELKLAGRHWGDLVIQNSSICSIPTSKMVTTVGGIEATWRFRIANTFCYNIHDGPHSSHLEDLQLSAYAVVS